jgi:hypothetical protein
MLLPNKFISNAMTSKNSNLSCSTKMNSWLCIYQTSEYPTDYIIDIWNLQHHFLTINLLPNLGRCSIEALLIKD